VRPAGVVEVTVSADTFAASATLALNAVEFARRVVCPCLLQFSRAMSSPSGAVSTLIGSSVSRGHLSILTIDLRDVGVYRPPNGKALRPVL